MAKIAFTSQKKNTARMLSESEQREVAKLAYQLFTERGGQHGFDKEDWHKAEAIIKSRRS